MIGFIFKCSYLAKFKNHQTMPTYPKSSVFSFTTAPNEMRNWLKALWERGKRAQRELVADILTGRLGLSESLRN